MQAQQAIEGVEQAISDNKKQQGDVKAAKEEGWRDELQWLREEEKQLRKKEEQLREEKLLLLRTQNGRT